MIFFCCAEDWPYLLSDRLLEAFFIEDFCRLQLLYLLEQRLAQVPLLQSSDGFFVQQVAPWLLVRQRIDHAQPILPLKRKERCVERIAEHMAVCIHAIDSRPRVIRLLPGRTR